MNSADLKHFAHASAIVDTGAEIGSGTKIWHFSHICAGAKIGENCIFGQNTYVGNNVQVGNRVKVQNNVSIYDDVTLEDEVFCGPSMVFTNVMNPRAAIERKNEFKKTVVRKGSTIGANATIVCGVELGNYCFIGAGAVITKDVKPFALMVGVPAVQLGWMSRYGEKIELPLSGSGQFTCSKTGDEYLLKGSELSLK